MVAKSREYLETMLEEYNEKVNRLENGDPVPLLEAYVNRGQVLAMMGHNSSAIDDFHSALEMAEEIEDSGGIPDRDSVFKALTSLGMSLYREGLEFTPALESASEMLGSLKRRVRHFDGKNMLKVCIECADALMDESCYGPAEAFLDRALVETDGSVDLWYRNRRAEAMSMYGECEGSFGRWDSAVEHYTDSIDLCERLLIDESLEDLEILCDAFMGRAMCHSALNQREEHVTDMMGASEIIRVIRSIGGEYDYDTEADINEIIGRELSGLGKEKEAEVYTIRSMTTRAEARRRSPHHDDSDWF